MTKSQRNKSRRQRQVKVSPFSTGGGGSVFEQQVGTLYLTSLLLKSPPHGHDSGEVREVRFQRRFVDNEALDDLIVLLEVPTAPSATAKLSLQLKYDMEWGLGETNTIYRDVMRACWKTFQSPEFNFEFDRFGVVLGVEKSSYRSYDKVLDQALHSASAQDFFQKIQTVEAAPCTTFIDLIRATLDSFLVENGGSDDQITDYCLWRFLRSMVVLRFDLVETQSKDRYYAIEHLRTVLSLNKSSRASDLWDKLFGLVSKGIPVAASYTRPDLIQKLKLKRVPFGSLSPETPQSMEEDGIDSTQVESGLNASSIKTASVGIVGMNEPSGLRKLPDDETQRLVSEGKLDAQIDAARTLIESGQINAARTLLEQAQQSAKSPLSPSLRFRIKANLGFCAFEMEDMTLAAAEFCAAYRSLPQSYKAKTVGAQGALMEGKFQDAITLCEEVLQTEPRYHNAALIYIQALAKNSDFQKLDDYVAREPWIEDEPSCSLALAEIRYEQGRFDETIGLLEDAHTRTPKDAGICSQLGFHLLQRSRREIMSDPPLLWRTPSSVIDDFEKAVELLSKSVAAFEKHDNKRHVLNDLVNRAAAYGLLDRYDDALHDCDRVLIARPDDQLALLNKGWTLFKQGKDQDAIPLLRKVLDSRWNLEALRSLALAHLRLGQWQEAVDAITSYLKADSDAPEYMELTDYKIHALDSLGRLKEAHEHLEELMKRFPQQPEVLVVSAHQQMRENNRWGAIQTLRQAVRLSSGRQKDRVTLSLAEAFYHLHRFKAAVRVYKKIIDESRPNTILRHYLSALTQIPSGHLEALRIARNIRKNGPAVVFYSEIEASLAEDVGDLKTAIRLRRELAQLEPEHPIHRLRLALMEFDNGNLAIARADLESIPRSVLQADPDLMMEVARAHATLGMSDALEIGYEARRLAPTDAQIQVEYVGLFQTCAKHDDPLLQPVQSRVHCALHIEAEGETTKWLLVEGQPISPEEISIINPRAQEFIGRRVGDVVTVKRALMGDVTGRVLQVQHRFVYAYQDVFHKLKTGQLVHPVFDVGEVGDPKEFLEKQAEAFKRRRQEGEDSDDIYRRYDLPLSVFAAVQNKPVIELWREVGEMGGRFIVSGDHHIDILRGAMTLHATQTLVLDPTAICTIALLELEEVIKRRYTRLIVPHAVWRELNQFYLSETINQGRAGILWHDGFRFHYRPISEEETEARHRFLKRALNFVKHETEIRPVPSLTGEPLHRRQGIGKSTLSAILLSRELGETLYSDDLRVRNLAHVGYNVRSTYIWPILSNLQGANSTPDQLWHALCQLVLHGYTYLVMPHQAIIYFLRSHKLWVNGNVRVLLHRILSGDEAKVEWAAKIAGNLIAALWKERVLDHQFRQILSAVLEALTSRRSTEPTLRALRSSLQAALFYDPLGIQQVWEDVERWTRGELQQIDIGSQLEIAHLETASIGATLALAHPRRRY